MAENVALYLGAGARLVWCVDPEHRTITVDRPNHDPVVLEEGDLLTGDDALPGFQCPVVDVFKPYWTYGVMPSSR
jgi:Uma2 family endonuclease